MSTGTGQDRPNADSPLPGNDAEAYFGQQRTVSREERRNFRNHYGWIRTHFKVRRHRYARTQRWLNQARIGTTYDVYLTRSVQYAILATVLGILAGAGVAIFLQATGGLASLTSPVRFPGDLGRFITRYRLWFAGGAITAASAVTLGLGTWVARYSYPRYVVDYRARAIDLTLPHAITYMYALAHGGSNLVEVVESVANADDTYGEVAKEFEVIVRDTDAFGSDLTSAIRNARNVTPSDSLERFLDDLLGVVESGGDVASFFEEEADRYLDDARDHQKGFLETLAVLSEIFVFAFIAVPLFVIVTLMVISFVGGETLFEMGLLIYVGMPLAMVVFVLVVDVLSAPYVQSEVTLDTAEDGRFEDDHGSRLEGDGRYADYRQTRRRKRLQSIVHSPFESVIDRPALSLFATVPLAIGVGALAAIRGSVEASPSAFVETPVSTTTWLVVIPVLVVAVPLSLLYEYKQRHDRHLAEQFPDALNTLSSANAMGIRLVDAMGLVSRYSTSTLGREMRKTSNDIRWNHDPRHALLLLANRLNVPHLTRTIKIVADGTRSTGDLKRILSIAAEDTRNRARMERDRRQGMSSYLVIVVVGFLVYLMAIVLIDGTYLAQFAEVAADQTTSTEGRELPVSLTAVPVETYRTLFFHSVLIQGFAAGLLSGKLAENRLLAGLKYSIALVVVSVGVFLII